MRVAKRTVGVAIISFVDVSARRTDPVFASAAAQAVVFFFAQTAFEHLYVAAVAAVYPDENTGCVIIARNDGARYGCAAQRV